MARKGWQGQSARHSLAARGIKTTGRSKTSARSVPPKSGAAWIVDTGHGDTMRDAFRHVVAEHGYQTGHGAYSGNFTTMGGFVDLTDEMKRLGMTPKEFVSHVRDDEDYAYDHDVSKGDMAGGIEVKKGTYVFFGWAAT